MVDNPTGSPRDWDADPRLDGATVEVYRTVGEVQLLIYHFASPGTGDGDARPGILFFHGGGWQGGEPAQFGEHCKYLAGRGMVALTAEYRVKSRQGVSPWGCIEDAAAAMNWTRANAPRLGIDPERLGAGGGSAGGHLAACIGTCPVIADAARPRALVIFNPVLDTVGEKWRERLAGRDPSEASPLHNVRPGLAPTLVMHGRDDATVPVAQAEDFGRAMTGAGNRCEVEIYDGAGHGFFNFAKRESGFYEKTLRRTDEFLTSLGWIS